MTDETDRGDLIDEALKGAADPAKPEKEPDPPPPPEKEPEKEPPEPTIPKSRFDEAVHKERSEKDALAARVKEYEERDAQSQVADDFAGAQKMVKDMIKQHTAFLADGELDKASDLMERILGLNQAVQDRRTDIKTQATKYAAKEEVQYDALVARLEVDHPALNPDSDDYDKDIVENLQALMTGFMQSQRLSAPQALSKAVKTLLPAKDATTTAAKGDEGAKRKEAAVKKALETKGKQPASLGGVGMDHDKEGGALDAAAVMKMTWDEFVKLPDEKLAEMRGDHIS